MYVRVIVMRKYTERKTAIVRNTCFGGGGGTFRKVRHFNNGAGEHRASSYTGNGKRNVRNAAIRTRLVYDERTTFSGRTPYSNGEYRPDGFSG